jgi:hypothetical protein
MKTHSSSTILPMSKTNQEETEKWIGIISQCEKLFIEWLCHKLSQAGHSIKGDSDLSEILVNYEKKCNGDQQHLKPLLSWNDKRCLCLDQLKNDQSVPDKELKYLLEKTAFEGQVLLLTFK